MDDRIHNVIDDADLDDGSSFKAVYAGAIGYVNNLELLVDTASKLMDDECEGRRIKFLIWGDGPELEKLRDDVRARNLPNIVFKGSVEKKYMPYILSKSDVNILQNKELPVHRFGTSQNKLFDYLAAGKPIIKAGQSGHDIVEGNHAGKTLNKYDANTLVDALLFFSKMGEDEYERYCRNSKELASEFDFAKLADVLVDVIGRCDILFCSRR